ncbi:MAG: Mur ligase family protein [Acidobacteriota bacterium]|nr:Mur ligase family protein [Acidobacteriota bacterium]
MNYLESLAYLYNLGNEITAMKLGLTSTEKLLAALGNPEKNFLKIQIAGTNGKGSTCAFLDAICRSARIKTGLFTSPHLISITERIKIDGAEISETDFARNATRVREIAEELVAEKELEAVPTFFEQMTAIGILAFAEAKIELAILETGLGGRFDSVTATRAEIAAITPIDFDHQQILGNTLAKIAAEKAAIIRKDTRVFVSPQKQEAENVIYGKCREVGVDLIWAIPNVKLVEDLGGGLLYLSFTTKENNYKVDFSMQGKHQWTNAALAICIAENLRDFNFKITKESVENGLETAEHKGRLEFWVNSGTCSILFDGAHNVAGAKALRDYLDEFIKQPVTMIFGAMRDKDLPEIAETIFPRAERLILTVPKNERSAQTSELLKFVPGNFERKDVTLAPTVQEAIEAAKKATGEGELILITGSLYLVGEAQEILKGAF